MSLATLWRRVRYFAKRDAAAADLQEEMQMHRDLRAEQLRKTGRDADDARHQAQRQFGNATIIAEEARGASGFGWAEHGLNDLRFAVRRLGHNRGFALAVIGIMSLGIGSTTAMFSAVDAALLRPLPFANPSELVWLRDIRVPFDDGTGVKQGAVHMLDVNDIASMKGIFATHATYAAGGLNVSDEGNPVRANAGVVTVDFFETLGIVPERGREFVAEEGRPGSAPVTIISHKFWLSHFGARDISNLSLSLNGTEHQVIGVMPDKFNFPRESDVWIPMTVPNTFATVAAFRGFLPSESIARVASGISVVSAELRLQERWKQTLSAADGTPLSNESAVGKRSNLLAKGALLPFQERLVGDKGAPLLILLGATALLLLIACANVVNLLLSQAAFRRREMALRAVLGATRARLVRQLLVESVLLALIGAILGMAAAPAALGVVSRLLPPVLRDISPARLDIRVLLFTVLLAIVAGIVFGLWPALGNSHDAAEDIKLGSGHGSTAGRLGVGRRLLIATELALTIVLLVAAGLMQRSFQHVMGLDRGMSADQVATLEFSFKSMPQPERMRILNDIITSLSAIPGVTAAGVVNDLPLRGGGGMSLGIKAAGPSQEMAMARYLIASSGYFDALGIRLLQGRTFTTADDSLSPSVAMVSTSMAKQFWPDKNAIGQVFDFMGKPVTVIGVVTDVREASLESDLSPQMYFSVAQQTPANVALVARGSLPAKTMLALLTNAVRHVDRTQAVYNVRMMEDVVGASVTPRRTNMMLISIFAGIALMLSALGVYAVVSYGVAQRARELGIRAALGARSSNLVSLVMGELVWVSIAGITAGLGGAWALSKLVSSMLYGVTPHDTATYVLVPVALLVPAAIAAVLPAHRAAQVDPAVVLRSE